MLMTTRAHSREDWRTELFVSVLQNGFTSAQTSKIQMPDDLSNHSHEDARLFQHQDKLWMSWTVSKYPAIDFRSVVVIGELVPTDSGWTVGRHFSPQFGKNDFSGTEKNWVCLSHQGSIYVLYLTHDDTQTWLKLDDNGGTTKIITSPALGWEYGPIHGGSIVRCHDHYLHFFNARTGKDHATGRYHIGCAKLKGEPPFDMLQISQKPILYGEEGYCLNGNKFYKRNVVFCCGAIMDGNKIMLSYGWDDSECRVVKLDEKDFNL